VHLDAAPGKKTRKPESVSPSLMGQYHSSDLPAGRCAPGLQTLDKRQQTLAASIQHMPRMSLDVMDAAERYARLLRGEDISLPALPAPENRVKTRSSRT
jgi:hypothetical protein